MRPLLAALAATRRRYGPGTADEKLRLLAASRERPLRSARAILAYHDHLLFLAAWPDDARVLAAVQAELHRVATAAPLARAPLENSGVAGTDVVAAFTPDLLAWLAARVHAHVEIDWDNRALADGVETLLPLLVAPAEADGLLARHLDTREWIRRARGDRATDLAWLLARLRALPVTEAVRERLVAALPLEIRWRLGRDSRTFTRFPARPIVHHPEPLARGADLATILEAPLPAPARLDAHARAALIDVARATLAVRARETDPVTSANPDETTLFRLEDGTDVALFGLLPARRLPIESYFGFVAAKNRVPVAYGGGWVLGGRCEIGVNLFPEFRGGESAHLFAQVLRTYRQHYRVTQFLVDPYQFGRGNTEAIRSGAFWFYWRLGFRPVDARLHAIADAEWHRLQAAHGLHTPAALLRRFTATPLWLAVPVGDPPTPGAWRAVAPDVAEIGLEVTDWLARTTRDAHASDGDRECALLRATRRVQRLLGVRRATGWAEHERAWFARLAPLVLLHPGHGRWSAAERRDVLAVLRAKGGARERDYALALGCSPLLRR